MPGRAASPGPPDSGGSESAGQVGGSLRLGWRLFLTCWVIYGLHFATDVVREHYLAISIGQDFSYRVDEFAGLHPDLFEHEGWGWHIGNNPGISMFAAIPYAVARPAVDAVVDRVNEQRAAKGRTAPPVYDYPNRPNAEQFFREAYSRGVDIKLGLGAFVTHAFFMAPLSALFAVFLFHAFATIFGSRRMALWLALLYAFGTPAFLRTGFLNHNLMLGHIVFVGFWLMWNPDRWKNDSVNLRYCLAGLTGGLAVLFDYSGGIMLLGLAGYGAFKRWRAGGLPDVLRTGTWFVLGTLPPVLLLWWYQYRSFGHPLYPGQHWMPPVAWIDRGYQGLEGPGLGLLGNLLFDIRYGLFVACPLFLLALAAPWARGRGDTAPVPRAELWSLLLIPLVLVIFFSGVNYTRLQFNTGIRYLAPTFPFLFAAAAVTLSRLPRRLAYFVGVLAVAQAWAMAMYRWVATPSGVLHPMIQTFAGGFSLPALRTAERMGVLSEFGISEPSPLPLFALGAVLIAGLWWRALKPGGKNGYVERGGELEAGPGP